MSEYHIPLAKELGEKEGLEDSECFRMHMVVKFLIKIF